MSTPERFFSLYRKNFLAAYSDLVALTTTKPLQILVEESNILSHLIQYNNSDLTPEVRQSNLDKAYNHLVRATLDLHKLLWSEIREKLDAFIIVDPKKRICFNIAEGELLQKYKEFVDSARNARKTEMVEIGSNPILAISLYEDVNKKGFELFKAIDTDKEKRVQRWSFRFTFRDLCVGATGSVIGAIVVWLFGGIMLSFSNTKNTPNSNIENIEKNYSIQGAKIPEPKKLDETNKK